MWKVYDLRVQPKMALKYHCHFCLSFEDAKHATNLFTVEAKHTTNLFTVEAKQANLLGRLGPIFLVVLTESDGYPVGTHTNTSFPLQTCCIAVNCSFLNTISGSSALLRLYDMACPNTVSLKLTAIVLN